MDSLSQSFFEKKIKARLSHTFYFSYNYLFWSTCVNQSILLRSTLYFFGITMYVITIRSFLVPSLYFPYGIKKLKLINAFYFYIHRKTGMSSGCHKGWNGFKSRLVFCVLSQNLIPILVLGPCTPLSSSKTEHRAFLFPVSSSSETVTLTKLCSGWVR